MQKLARAAIQNFKNVKRIRGKSPSVFWPQANLFYTVVLIRDQTRSVAKQVSVAVGWVKIKISLMAQLKGLTAKFKLM